MPLYRQAPDLRPRGPPYRSLDIGSLVGFAAVEFEPLHARLLRILKASTKLCADETRCPVLDPGRGRTKKGYLWTIARGDRPWAALIRRPLPISTLRAAAPSMPFPSCRLQRHPAGRRLRYLLTDAKRAGGPLTLAFCWSHFRRRFYEIAKGGNARIAMEALERIAQLYVIEAEIRGQSSRARLAERQARIKPLVDDLNAWLAQQLARVPGRSPIAEAIRYGLSHGDGFVRSSMMAASRSTPTPLSARTKALPTGQSSAR